MKDIPGYEGRYAVTKDGRVWSHRKKTSVGKNGGVRIDGNKWLILTESNPGRGYQRIALVDYSGNRKMLSVHRLVAITYIPNPDNLPFINHKNGVTTDNRVENLEWCDAKGNSVHAFNNGCIKTPDQAGENNSQAKMNIQDVRNIRRLSEQGIGDTEISRTLNLSRNSVKGVTKHKTWRLQNDNQHTKRL